MLKLFRRIKDDYKWGVSYSVFDGEELLEESIKSIRDSADYINIVYQKISYKGEPCDENLVAFLQSLVDKGLVDEIIEYKTDLKLKPGKNEIRKRNLGLKYAKKAKCNYFMTMDADEFYKKDEVEKAKAFIIKKRITYSYCYMLNYGLAPTKLNMTPAASYVQFFSKIDFLSHLRRTRAITVVDPTRTLASHIGAKHWFLDSIAMHHMSLIRKNLNSKFKNSSCNYTREQIDDFYKNYDEGDFIDCPDTFNLQEKVNSFKSIEQA